MPVGITMGTIAVGGGIISAIGQKKAAGAAAKGAQDSGKAQRAAAESGADLADYNAKVADLQAQDAVARGADAESRFRSQVKGAIGNQRAGFAAGNIDVGFGSSVDVQADAAFLGELDALQIRTNAQREAWGFKVQATDLRKRAEIARKEGVYLEKAGEASAAGARSAGNWGAASALVGGVTSGFQLAYGFKKASS